MARGKDKWSKLITHWYPREGKRKRGRQQKRWDDDIRKVGITWSRVARERSEWSRLEEAFANWQTDLQNVKKHQIRIRPIFDGARPVGDRVVNVTVRCIDCPVPRYEPLQLDKTYRVVSQNFVEQGGGVRPIFDGARPVGDRVVNVTVRCIDCPVPRYEPLQLDKTYRVVSQNFIGQGGGGYTAKSLIEPMTAGEEGSRVATTTWTSGWNGFPLGRLKTWSRSRATIAQDLVEPYCLCVESHNSYLTRRRVKHLSLTQYSGKEAPSDVALRPVRAPMISENRRNVEDVGIDYEVLQNYMARMSPILSDVDGRMQISNPCLV
ncbi:5'-nucleotidase [Eumeta japonica]|uniref:5'-nucleotidase n=1 Tax=Eumeta variegata TaxID=151549 RepID=A0A4C1TNK8_EUMVA|nr:5'-nucleotidase [Eumeta japonica]